jgi:hypothetical protein
MTSGAILACTACLEIGLAVGYGLGYAELWVAQGRAMVMGMLSAARGAR